VKKNGLFLGMLGIVLAFGLLFTGCEPEPELGGDEDKYTVTFYAGDELVTSVQVISGKAVGELLPTPEDTSNNFFWGWFTQNGTNAWVDFFTKSTVVTKDITVYARWENRSVPTICTVTFNANGGTVIPSTKEVIFGEAVGTLPTPIKSGYMFGGWSVDEDGGGDFTKASIITEDGIEVYAKWTVPEDVTITGDVYDWQGNPLTELTKTFTHYHGMGSPTMKTLKTAGIENFVVENGKLNATLPGMPKVFESNADLRTKLKITEMSDPDAKIFFLNALRDSAAASGPSLLYYYSGDAAYYIYSDREVEITGARNLTLKAGWNIPVGHPYKWTYGDF
jgi:uncharacterized repeat protein (TIGR02543 family)